MIKFEFDLDGTGNKLIGYIYLDCYLLSSLDITHLIAKSTEDFDKWFAIDQPKPGYYVLNHLTMKNQHVGETWTEAADYLDGKIIALWGDEVLEQP